MATIYKKYDGVANVVFSNNVIIVPCDYGDGQGTILTIPDGEIWDEARVALAGLEDASEPVLPDPEAGE